MCHQIGSQNLSEISKISAMNPLEILRETIRILRAEPSTFMSIFALLICPFSSFFLSNFLLNQSFVSSLGQRFVLLAVSSGLPHTHFLKQICHRLAGTLVSSLFSFPLLITLLLFARACISFSVASNYAGKKVVITEFKGMVVRIIRRLVLTYVCNCAAIVSCVFVFSTLILAVCRSFYALGYPPALLVLFGFAVAYAYVVVVCNVAGVICVLEDACGPIALLRSMRLVKGRMKAGLVIFVGTSSGLGFVEGLFEHRVKSLSYGDGSSRIWEGPLLVVMYSFVVLVDSMMSAVFYFSCRSSSVQVLNEQMLGELEPLSFESTIAE